MCECLNCATPHFRFRVPTFLFGQREVCWNCDPQMGSGRKITVIYDFEVPRDPVTTTQSRHH